jgi:hypothetical protein
MRDVLAIALALATAVVLLSACMSHTKTSIDWISFVQVRGRQYVAVQSLGAPATSPAVLGRAVATVRKTIAGHVFDPHYRPRDGDAAFLPVGTRLREVRGFAPWFRLGALVDGDVTIYQLDRRDGTGAEVFDLDASAIRSLEIRRASDDAFERTLTDPALVHRLVAAIEAARVHATDVTDGDATCVVAFTYADTPSIALQYRASSGTLSPGITLDAALRHDLAGVGCG